jgi:hypothetical protein
MYPPHTILFFSGAILCPKAAPNQTSAANPRLGGAAVFCANSRRSELMHRETTGPFRASGLYFDRRKTK